MIHCYIPGTSFPVCETIYPGLLCKMNLQVVTTDCPECLRMLDSVPEKYEMQRSST